MQPVDVVVIGAGGAGLTAAIAARQQGARVALLSKTASGLGTCTAYAGGGFTLAVGQVTPEEHAIRTKEIGRQINQDALVEVLSREGAKALEELQRWGITIRVGDNGHASVASSAPKPIMGGAGFTRELTDVAKRFGVQLIENVVVTRLVVGDGRVRGVEFIDWQAGKAAALSAKSVVLANGGAGQIYARTDNPARITGDGYALALEAGLPLIDMEFVQFYPLGWAEAGFPEWMIGLPILDHVRLTDEAGDEFLLRSIREWGLTSGREANLFARDKSARIVGERVFRGEKVLLHLEEADEHAWSSYPLKELRSFYPAGKEPKTHGPVSIAPIQHYFTGGIPIDTDGRTAIPGLYACGEVTGGVDGASRIGGNALTNIVTFGLRAGRVAANESAVSAVRLDAPFSQEMLTRMQQGSFNPLELRQSIKSICWNSLGPVRNAGSLADAITELETVQAKLLDVKAASSRERLLALELPGMWMSARAVAQAALTREESRGVHYRSDFPLESACWQRSFRVAWQNSEMITRL